MDLNIWAGEKFYVKLIFRLRINQKQCMLSPRCHMKHNLTSAELGAIKSINRWSRKLKPFTQSGTKWIGHDLLVLLD